MSFDPCLSDRETIDVLLVSDANYSAYLATTMVSILLNAAPDDVLRFHIVDGGLTDDDRAKIEAMKATRTFDVKWYRPDMQEFLQALPAQKYPTFPYIVNCRLFAGKYLPATLDKVLYLDVDTIVLKSLRELWNAPLGDSFLGAVCDPKMSLTRRRALGLPDDYPYFNSGVLLINLKKWREANVLDDLIELYAQKSELFEFPDQDLLNVYANNSSYCQLLDIWNCHPKNYVEGKTGLIHFMGGRRHCPCLDLLYGYAARTPYRQLPLQDPKYKFKRALRRVLSAFVCVFIFSRKKRRSFRKRFNLR